MFSIFRHLPRNPLEGLGSKKAKDNQKDDCNGLRNVVLWFGAFGMKSLASPRFLPFCVIFAVSPCPLEYQRMQSKRDFYVVRNPLWGHCRWPNENDKQNKTSSFCMLVVPRFSSSKLRLRPCWEDQEDGSGRCGCEGACGSRLVPGETSWRGCR